MYQHIYDITVKRHNLDSMTRIVEHITSKITYIIFSVLWTKLKLYHSCLCLCYSSICSECGQNLTPDTFLISIICRRTTVE